MAEITPMIRRMEERDVVRAGAVMAAAFNAVFVRHGFPRPFPSSEVGIQLARGYLYLEPHECFVAVEGGQVVGSGFIHLRGETAGIGPITVDPTCQARGVGKELMQAVIHAGRHCSSLRLVQDAFNLASFALYSTLGFAACGTVAALVGEDIQPTERTRDIIVRELTMDNLSHLSALDATLTGITRPQDWQFFLSHPPQFVALRDDRPAGYLCALRTQAGTFLGPAAATDQTVLTRLLAHAVETARGQTLRLRVPSRHAELLSALLKRGFRVEVLETYMVRGPWKPPTGIDLLALFPEAL